MCSAPSYPEHSNQAQRKRETGMLMVALGEAQVLRIIYIFLHLRVEFKDFLVELNAASLGRVSLVWELI